jgi:hypothetical protein
MQLVSFKSKSTLTPRSNILQSGQAATEYLIATALLALAMALGNPSPLERIFLSVAQLYRSYTYSLSLP